MTKVLEFLQIVPFQPGDLLTVLALVVLEGLLSCDNAVVLAMMVRRLPADQQGKALRYGIVGAYVFLFGALLAAVWIMNQWYLKVLGGAYLLWVAAEPLLARKAEHDHSAERPVRQFPGLGAFWSTVVSVELTDIAFSVDSIAAAVALSNKLWVLYLGGTMCILAMRFAAKAFIVLLRRFPKLEIAAFAAVAFIGLKLIAEFPVDVAGRTHPFPAGATYASAEEYHRLLAENHRPAVVIPHVLVINTSAAPPPEEKRFVSAHEYRTARAEWSRDGRAFLHFHDVVASAAMVGIIALGFVGRKKVEAGN